MRVLTYGRVSTADQVDRGTSLKDQKHRLSAATRARSALHIAHFEDPGISGALESRPGLDALLARVAEGDIDLVLATKIDRVSRSAVGLLKFVEALRQHKCDLVLIDEGLDTSTPAGDLTSGVLGVIGGWERRRIAERTHQGRINAAQREGRFVGSTPPYGYRVVPGPDGKGKQLAIDAGQAEAVRFIYERLIIGGASAATVANELNKAQLRPARAESWTAATLRRWALREPPVRAASGIWVFKEVHVPIPAILTADEASAWRKWQRDRRATVPVQHRRGPYLLSGFLLMPCGRHAMGRTAGQQRPTYSCRQHYLPSSDPERHQDCHNSAARLLDDAVISHVRAVLSAPKLLEGASIRYLGGDDTTEEYATLAKELRNIQDEIESESRGLRKGGLRGESLAVALLPLQERREQLSRDMRAAQRRGSAAAALRNPEVRDRITSQARLAMEGNDPNVWRALLNLLRASISIDGFRPCNDCGGSGYYSFAPRSGRRWPESCGQCLRGRNPDITIEIDDLAALVAAEAFA